MAEKIASTNRSSGLAILRGGSRRRRRWLIIAVVAIALAVVVAVAYRPVYHYISWNLKSPAAQKAEITDQINQQLSTAIKSKTINFSNTRSQQTSQKQYDSTLKYLSDKLRITRNGDTRYFLLQQETLVYTNANRLDQALTVLQQMNQQKPDDYLVITSIANVADQLGNKALALQYYQKTVDYLQAHPSPRQNYDLSGLQARIKVLQGQQP